MKKLLSLFLILVSLVLTSCGGDPAVPVEVTEVAAVRTVDVNPELAAELVASKAGLVILDVRTPEEFAEGHLAGAVNIDFKGADFAAKVGELDPAKPYLVHCRSGARSGASLPVLEALNFTELYHLNTGYLGWTEAGKPVEK